MYEDDVTSSEFFSGNTYIALSFQIKKSNSKSFAHVSFRASEMSIKFRDFAAGMDFDT